jgi:hypothetical protein
MARIGNATGLETRRCGHQTNKSTPHRNSSPLISVEDRLQHHRGMRSHFHVQLRMRRNHTDLLLSILQEVSFPGTIVIFGSSIERAMRPLTKVNPLSFLSAAVFPK